MLTRIYAREWMFFKTRLARLTLVWLILLAVMAFVNYDYYLRHPDKAKSDVWNVKEHFERAGILSNYRNNQAVFIGVLLNNLIYCLKAIAVGIIPFAFLSGIFIVEDGSSYGLMFAVNELFQKRDIVSFVVDYQLHCVFELPAIIYAASIGAFLTMEMSRKCIPKYRGNSLSFRILCEQIGRSTLTIVVPLLLAAALIESL